jgi:hypothetical protein
MSFVETKQHPIEVPLDKGQSEFVENAYAADGSVQGNALRDVELMAGEKQEKVSSQSPSSSLFS